LKTLLEGKTAIVELGESQPGKHVFLHLLTDLTRPVLTGVITAAHN
jgi:hypothetical protein